jgi:hypothetical protein
MTRKSPNAVLTSVLYLFAALALWTLLPLPPAVRNNDFGYRSACPFAPWSSLALLVVAGLAWAVRQYLITRAD